MHCHWMIFIVLSYTQLVCKSKYWNVFAVATCIRCFRRVSHLTCDSDTGFTIGAVIFISFKYWWRHNLAEIFSHNINFEFICFFVSKIKRHNCKTSLICLNIIFVLFVNLLSCKFKVLVNKQISTQLNRWTGVVMNLSFCKLFLNHFQNFFC